MGRHISWLSDEIEDMVETFWNTDVREHFGPSVSARDALRQSGTYDAIRSFLLDVIRQGTVSAEEWGSLCNLQVHSRSDVQIDAGDCWNWLFDGESLPSDA